MTLATVGYGVVTSYFVCAQEDEKAEREQAKRDSELDESREALRRIEERFASIEATLAQQLN